MIVRIKGLVGVNEAHRVFGDAVHAEQRRLKGCSTATKVHERTQFAEQGAVRINGRRYLGQAIVVETARVDRADERDCGRHVLRAAQERRAARRRVDETEQFDQSARVTKRVLDIELGGGRLGIHSVAQLHQQIDGASDRSRREALNMARALRSVGLAKKAALLIVRAAPQPRIQKLLQKECHFDSERAPFQRGSQRVVWSDAFERELRRVVQHQRVVEARVHGAGPAGSGRGVGVACEACGHQQPTARSARVLADGAVGLMVAKRRDEDVQSARVDKRLVEVCV